MTHTGYIDWHRLSRSEQHAEIADGRQTYVYAYWLVDYGRAVRDQGVSLLKREDSHPDWFIHAENADHVLAAYCHPRTVVSPQFSTVYDDNLAARPLLAAMLLGTSDRFYRTSHTRPGTWWCTYDDLNWRGRRLVRQISRLYERAPHLVTFVDAPTDESGGPRDPR